MTVVCVVDLGFYAVVAKPYTSNSAVAAALSVTEMPVPGLTVTHLAVTTRPIYAGTTIRLVKMASADTLFQLCWKRAYQSLTAMLSFLSVILVNAS